MNDEPTHSTPSGPASGSVNSEELLGNGFHLDLSTRPSLADLGLEPGQTQTVHELPEGSAFDAEVTFAEGTELQATAQNLTASAVADRPRTLALGTPTLDLAGVRDAVEAAPGLDPVARDRLATFAAASAKSGEFGRRVVDAEVGSPDSMQIEVVVDRPDEFHLNYLITLGR